MKPVTSFQIATLFFSLVFAIILIVKLTPVSDPTPSSSSVTKITDPNTLAEFADAINQSGFYCSRVVAAYTGSMDNKGIRFNIGCANTYQGFVVYVNPTTRRAYVEGQR
jgi:hypothetical protein